MHLKLHKNLILILSLLITSAAAQSTAETPDALLQALEDEMNRSTSALQLKDFGKPYFVEYAVDDAELFAVEAEFGALQYSGFDRSRTASIQVRVGSYDSDNTNLYAAGAMTEMVPLVIDDNYDSIRHDVWLATDLAYKSAIEQFSNKNTYLRNNAIDEKLPDLSRERPINVIGPRGKLRIDAANWTNFIRKLSNVFRGYPEVSDSHITLSVRSSNRYLINNEGTRLRQYSFFIILTVYAEARTADNLKLAPSKQFFAKSIEDMPSFDEIQRETEALARDVTALRKAPSLDEVYVGPALFTDRAAAQLFSQLIAPNLGAERLPAASRNGNIGIFSDRLNRRILPPALSIVDDPTVTVLNGQKLLGAYNYDEQGVAAEAMAIVEDGILKRLFTNRVPTKYRETSNGRARLNFGRTFVSNMIVGAKGGKSFAELKKELVDACRAQNLPFGLLFREISSTPFLSGHSLSQPIQAYKVFVEDGREERVRNLSFDAFPVRELRQILAVGDEAFTINEILGSGQSGGGVGYSVSAPSILLDEIVLRKDSSTKSRPVIVTNTDNQR